MIFNELHYESDPEEQDDCRKKYHYAVSQDGQRFIIKHSPYSTPTQSQFEEACIQLYKDNIGARLSAPNTAESFKLGFLWVYMELGTSKEVLDTFGKLVNVEFPELPNYDVYITTDQGTVVSTGNLKLAKNHVDKRFCNIQDIKN